MMTNTTGIHPKRLSSDGIIVHFYKHHTKRSSLYPVGDGYLLEMVGAESQRVNRNNSMAHFSKI